MRRHRRDPRDLGREEHNDAPRLRVALVGCGGIARQYHLPALHQNPEVNVAVVADPSPEALAGVPNTDGVQMIGDVDAVFERDDLDAVVVCAPTPVHAELGQMAARRGLHLYLEKPVALSVADAIGLEHEVEAAGIVAMVGFNYRFNPLHCRLKRMLHEGELGEVRRVRSWFWEPAVASRMPAWKRNRASGGGVMLDLASHELDQARWLLDDDLLPVDRVAISSIESEGDVARLEFRSAGGVEVECSLALGRGLVYRWEVEGSEATVRLDRWPPRISRRRRQSREPHSWAARVRGVPIPKREPSFAIALEAFVDAALGRDRDLPLIGDGRRSLELVLAAAAAAR